MGEQKHTRIAGRSVDRWFSFDDYPPGTPLPERPEPDLSELSPVQRAMLRRGMRKSQSHLRSRLEAHRDEYWRRKTEASDGEGPTDE